MYNRINTVVLSVLLSAVTMISCQKEIDGTVFQGGVNPTTLTPRVGTTWTYRYYIFHQDGSLYQASIMTFKAKSEDTIAGQKWLRIVDVNTDTTVWLMQPKADGLYQYTGNNVSLFCKEPASVGDVYNTYNDGFPETFYVRTMKDTTATGIGNIPLNYYEGYRSNLRVDLIWYNKNAWIVWKTQYRNRAIVGFFWYKHSSLFLDQIVY